GASASSAVTRDKAAFRMYVDGVYNAKGETGRSSGADGDIDHPGWYPMTIGRDLWYEGFFTGAIDELRISNVPRTAFFESTPVATGSIVSPRITFERERVAEVRLDWGSIRFRPKPRLRAMQATTPATPGTSWRGRIIRSRFLHRTP
ncbi:MAG TPA: hypothetical protein DIT01_11850, partial [Lentisphaeria bacterium]|nr:hypothetical protein [Lentisphaeria bacterium]